MSRLVFPLVVYPIVAIFWLTMSIMLIRSELRPQDDVTRAVPIEHVARLLFHDDQASDLYIHSDGVTVGNLRISPRLPNAESRKIIDFSGNLQTQMPQMGRRRVTWDGEVTLNDAFELRMFQFGFSIREAGATNADNSRIEVTIDPIRHVASYGWKSRDGFEDVRTYPLDRSGLDQLMDHLGIDSTIVQSGSISEISAPQITARQSSLEVRNGRVETFQVTVVQNEQTVMKIDVSEAGKILSAWTIVGWTLDTE